MGFIKLKKDVASQYRGVFAKVMTMRENQISAKPMGI